MSVPISPISVPTAPLAISSAAQPAATTQGAGEFSNLIQGAIQKVEQTNSAASQAVQGFLAGDGQELHTVILATQRADLAFELGLQVRNKVVSAYQEIMRMQM